MTTPATTPHALLTAAGLCTWSWLPLSDAIRFEDDASLWGRGPVPQDRTTLIERLLAEDRAAFADALERIRLALPGSLRSVDHRLQPLGSTLRRFRTHLLRAETPAGEPSVLALSVDVSREQALEDQVELLFERAPVGIVFLGTDGRLYRPNPALIRMLGYEQADDIEAQPAAALILPGGRLREPGEGEQLSPPQFLHYLKHRNGEHIPVKLFESELGDGDSQRPGTLLQIVNRSAETRIRQHLEDAANRDWVTGLFNQRYLLRRLEERLRQRSEAADSAGGGVLALLSLNLSGFRQVIDLAGHLAGDQVLKEASYLLLRGLREDDDLFRSGGDYFFVLMERPSLAEIETTALGLLREVKDHSFVVEGIPLRLLATCGLRQVQAGDADPVQLIADADAACRAAKRIERGSLRAFSDCDRSVDNEVRAAVRLKRVLEAALDGAFVTVVEPLISTVSGLRSGHELLTRLRRADGRLESIGSYVQAAERAFSAVPVDIEILRHTLPRLQRWAAQAEVPPFFTINLSAHSLQSERFLDTLLALMDAHPLPQNSLYFELTETAAVTQPEQARRAVKRLQAQGARLIVDDFGAGFSSLGSLMELGVAGLKLDRSLTGGIVGDPVRRKVVQALVELAHSLDGFVIAEGVERAEEYRAAVDIGTDYLQGFYFGVGVPLDDLLS
jgi:diguanylate cyclase (GGDEF)-like protein/PAS domain S-box-containing protein